MAMRPIFRPGLIALTCLLAACSGGEGPDLMILSNSGGGPDEFRIVPSKPLAEPPDASVLPPPAPGATNRADATPQADAIAALGGRPEAASGTVRGSDIVAYTGRFGRDPAIRQTLAAEDLAFRRRNDGLFLERLFNLNLYFEAYRSQHLDQQGELERFRRAGIPTPAAPPPEFKPE